MKKVLLILRDIIELYIPAFAFCTMFVVFIVQVFFRYVINFPLTWSQEISVIGFCWAVALGACYSMRFRTHVKFTLIYDMLSPKAAAITRLIGNVIIMLTFIMLVIPSIQFVGDISVQFTAVFKIRLGFFYAPFVYFLLSVIGYTGAEVLEDVRIISGRDQDDKKEESV